MHLSIILTKYYSSNQIEKNEKGGIVAIIGERRVVNRILVGKREGKRQLGRHRRRWEDVHKVGL
jgi:predicted transcriptional regulator